MDSYRQLQHCSELPQRRAGVEEAARVVGERERRPSWFQRGFGLESDVDRVFDQTLDRFGVSHVIINNATTQTWQPFLKLGARDWDRPTPKPPSKAGGKYPQLRNDPILPGLE